MVKNSRTYLYEIRSYREQGKVKQESRYLAIETEINDRKNIKAPKNRTPVRKTMESSGYIFYRVVEKNDFVNRYFLAINDLTRINDPARRIVMLAAGCITDKWRETSRPCQPYPHSQKNWWITEPLRS